MPRFLLGLLAMLFASLPIAASSEVPKAHRMAVQIDTGDAAVMNLALGNIGNAADFYAKHGETIAVEIVAYGPGLAMLRDDVSPVKDRLASLRTKVAAKNPSVPWRSGESRRYTCSLRKARISLQDVGGWRALSLLMWRTKDFIRRWPRRAFIVLLLAGRRNLS